MKYKSLIKLLLSIFIILTCGISNLCAAPSDEKEIPLPEHPRPDFMRTHWLNLNGHWEFQFDKDNIGLQQQWQNSNTAFTQTILTPFPWGSKLSGVKDEADIGWYAKNITIPDGWGGQDVFVVIGACDWHTTAWLDGQKLGEHQGGYTPFDFKLPENLTPGKTHRLVLRVDDTPHKFKLEGKQGYGRAAGIWQTVYLEARPQTALDVIHFTPDIDDHKVTVKIVLNKPAPRKMDVTLNIKSGNEIVTETVKKIGKGKQDMQFDVAIENPRLWSLDDPYLYDVTAVLSGKSGRDVVTTYFGMRKISVGNLPGTNIPYIFLNNKPVYLQLALDQAYHPDGYYTFPSDEFMRDEILRSRMIGLNGQRIHVKIGIPRKLYWADKLGVLIMADVPNSWGEPDADMRREAEYAMRQMIKRDYNHPAIFSWVLFNETWGLFTDKKYLPETQKWVAEMYKEAKSLDPSRLVEDNSECNDDHVVTDINTWHAYLPGYAWKERLDQVVRDTYPGSPWNFVEGYKQANQPNINSECGNVWGYKGSTGDVDWSFDYHRMMNEFRRHPQIGGWLYTEHHDVINEWNGYYKFDRGEKMTGLSGLVPGMKLNDLHSEFYISTGQDICRAVKPGETVSVPLFVSFMTDRNVGSNIILKVGLYGWDNLGIRESYSRNKVSIAYEAWMNRDLEPLQITMPDKPALAVLSLVLEDVTGTVLHRNFTTFVVADGASPKVESPDANGKKLQVIRFAPDSFADAKWSGKQWNVLDGLKVNGAGSGYFEYRVKWPRDLAVNNIREATFRAELSAKQLFGKDRDDAGKLEGDYMRGKGAHDPSLNPNAYPMTDERRFPSMVEVLVNGLSAGIFALEDDPADHRGILSWFSQPQDRKLREAGSYGYLVSAHVPESALKQAAETGELVIRLKVGDALPGGLAVYGERFGRYPVEPMVVFEVE